MRLADIQRLVGLTEKQVAMTAFDEASELDALAEEIKSW